MINIKDIRCPNCNQLLLKADYIKGEIKCPRCRDIVKIDNPKTEFRATQ
ncbi:MAG: Com family DNA-binding transcriptional regulator [Clostridium sp.]